MAKQFSSKGAYITFRFNEDFPDIPGIGYEEVLKLIQKNTYYAKWYASVLLEWNDYSQLPDYLEGVMTPDEYQSVAELLNRFREADRFKSTELSKIASEAQKKAEAVNTTYQNRIKPCLASAECLVLRLNFVDLPPDKTSGLILNDYPTDEDRKRVEDNALSEYKRGALIRIKEGTFDIKEVSPSFGSM
ncbi:hypothetical protein MMARV_C029P2 [viral metagenome]|uniref:Uncharacterized protein n=1 Tax=viral metagenome TaxID=1070528 RepID=A0A6L2ZKK0_9ZZZZ